MLAGDDSLTFNADATVTPLSPAIGFQLVTRTKGADTLNFPLISTLNRITRLNRN